ncbi:MAG: CBS domain-containing protein, partial [Candidatus Bathyarchaeia archaeon]
MSRETFRRTLRGKGPVYLRGSAARKREGDVMHIAKSPVVVMAPTTPIYDAVKIMAKEGFRRIPIADPGTKTLVGIVTATDLVDYLGGGKKFEIVQQKFSGNIFKAINEPIKLIMNQKVFTVKTTAGLS